MKYLPTVDLWSPGMITALRSKQLRLQKGQWVYCGRKDHKSRYVGVNANGTIWAAHWSGSGKASNKRFHTLSQAFGGKS